MISGFRDTSFAREAAAELGVDIKTAKPSDIADVVVGFMRRGRVPDECDADYLNRLPIVDELRARITEQDLIWIWPVIDNESGERFGLFLSLLRKFTTRSDVQEHLRKRWRSATSFARAHLMWRILDDPKLSAAWHKKLFAFVLKNWQDFQGVSLKFLGTPQTVVVQTLKRLADPSFPASKKWAYLCRVPSVADDEEAAIALISMGLLMKDKFTREVARALLRRFFGKSNRRISRSARA
jgi:hypothetical protein